MDHHLCRWLLRPLADPRVLRLLFEDPPPYTFEYALEQQEPDPEHDPAHRDEALRLLRGWLGPPGTPLARYGRLLDGLQRWIGTLQDAEQNEVLDLARVWASEELVPLALRQRIRSPRGSGAHHELHAHFRSSVPFETLWDGWVRDARWRAGLGKKPVWPGSDWAVTWAEAVERAATPGAPPTLVQAVRTALHAHLTYRRGEPGLWPFSQLYDLRSKLSKHRVRAHDGNLVMAVAQRFEQEQTIALELRPTLERRPAETRRKLRNLVRGYLRYVARGGPSRPPLALALLPSLYKGERLGDDWGAQQELWVRQTEELLEILATDPILRRFVVGLDAAGQERGCPLRVFAPVVRQVREYSARHGLSLQRPGRTLDPRGLLPARRSGMDEDDWAQAAWDQLAQDPPPPCRLGLTLHAGEDFDDPLSGLRHIWEALQLLRADHPGCPSPGPGDRLGHALAAGLARDQLVELLDRRSLGRDPEIRVEEPGRRWTLRKPRGTHVLDLAWAWQVCEPEHREVFGPLLVEATGQLFGGPQRAAEIAADLARLRTVPELDVPAARFLEPRDVHPTDRVWVPLDHPWLDRFERLRQRVLRELRVTGLVVESCPTSNLVVANLRAPVTEQLLRAGVRVAVATDNPGLMEAWPGRELARLAPADRQQVEDVARTASFVQRA